MMFVFFKFYIDCACFVSHVLGNITFGMDVNQVKEEYQVHEYLINIYEKFNNGGSVKESVISSDGAVF